jgi:hypothetical protein
MRYAKAKVSNRFRLLNDKITDIVTNEPDGRLVQIQDGAIVELSEYVYNNLKDAIVADTMIIKEDDSKPAVVRKVLRNRVDVTLLSDFYEKDSDGNKIEEKIEEIPVVEPIVEQQEPNHFAETDLAV